MALKVLDTVGLKSPEPIVKIALTFSDINKGDILEVWGDCPIFEKDVRYWCKKMGKSLVCFKEDIAGKKKIQIQM
jgi:tRNA 2-thiouridine synthesizing protein A